MNRAAGCCTLLIVLGCEVSGFSQWAQMPMTGSQPRILTDRTMMAGQSGLGPLMTADFVDKYANAGERRAVIDVHTDGVQMVDPAGTGNMPSVSQAHVQYQVDDGTPVNTTSRRIQLDNLSPGEHHIQVALAGNDNKPMGRETMLNLHIPGSQ